MYLFELFWNFVLLAEVADLKTDQTMNENPYWS